MGNCHPTHLSFFSFFFSFSRTYAINLGQLIRVLIDTRIIVKKKGMVQCWRLNSTLHCFVWICIGEERSMISEYKRRWKEKRTTISAIEALTFMKIFHDVNSTNIHTPSNVSNRWTSQYQLTKEKDVWISIQL